MAGAPEGTVVGEKIVFNIDNDYKTLKIFAWQELEQLLPVLSAETFVFD